jgi:hypothetical protein
MKLKSCQIFAILCEGAILEVSSSMDLVKRFRGGPQIVSYLHKKAGLGHNQEYKQIDKISWNVLKDASKGAWVLMRYPRGIGAIRQTDGNYEALASQGQEPTTFKSGRGGNILDFLKGELGGNPISLYVGIDTGEVINKRTKRKSYTSKSKSSTFDYATLMVKFKPLWVKAIFAAKEDVRGMIGTMIKNGAHWKLDEKIKRWQSLENALDNLEGSNPSFETAGLIKRAVVDAVIFAAGYFYPNETGNISKPYRSSSVNSEKSTGPQHILDDISKGDTKKLGAVLSFFKKRLITG